MWGFRIHDNCNKIQQRALKYFLAMHAKTLLLAPEGDCGDKTYRNAYILEQSYKMNQSSLTTKVLK